MVFNLSIAKQRLCTEAAFAASLAHSSGPFLVFDFAFGVFSGVSLLFMGILHSVDVIRSGDPGDDKTPPMKMFHFISGDM